MSEVLIEYWYYENPDGTFSKVETQEAEGFSVVTEYHPVLSGAVEATEAEYEAWLLTL